MVPGRAVLVGVLAESIAAAAAAAVRVVRALPAPLVVPRQTQATAALDVVELRQLVEPGNVTHGVSGELLISVISLLLLHSRLQPNK